MFSFETLSKLPASARCKDYSPVSAAAGIQVQGKAAGLRSAVWDLTWDKLEEK